METLFSSNRTILTDPTIRQPGLDLPRHTRSPMNRLWTDQGHVVLTCTNASPSHFPVIVASDRP